jgi:hypothetical protein
VGACPLDFRVTRTPSGGWSLNGRVVPGLDGCVDLDFGFTPATNLVPARRVALEVGQDADVPVAWLEVPDGTLTPLHQRYGPRSCGRSSRGVDGDAVRHIAATAQLEGALPGPDRHSCSLER